MENLLEACPEVMAIRKDITLNLATIKDIQKNIIAKDFPEEIDVRGEVFIQNSDFENLKDNFANPRNAHLVL